MISLSKASKIISEVTLNGITYNEWESLPLGQEALERYTLSSNGMGSTESCTRFLAEEFKKYIDYVEANYEKRNK